MDIAICGIRGIPACYGGFETFAEELSSRLVKRGHRVAVYGRKHVIKFPDSYYRGVEIKLLPAPRHKYLETPLHTLLCLLHLQFRRPDVVLVCNAANSPMIWINQLTRIPTVVNVDGVERKRAKWNALGKAWYRFGEHASVWFASEVIADAEVIREYYLSEHNCSSTVIPYGYVETTRAEDKANGVALSFSEAELQLFAELGVEPLRYVLFVSRLEPENNAHILIEAYNQLQTNTQKFPLLIVGDAPYSSEYIQHLKQIAGPNVVFAGYRFGESYRVLQLGAYLYVQATEVGGTHPALVEAMGFGNCIIANATPENCEVVGDAAMTYPKNSTVDLCRQLSILLEDETAVGSYRKRALERAQSTYSWERVTDLYEEMFHRVVCGGSKKLSGL